MRCVRRRARWTIAGALLATACAGGTPAAPDAEPRRNVVLILSDDHRHDFMSFLGTPPFLETPSLDRLAAEGMHVRNAFVSTALCSPSRASILTGQYAHRHGVVDNQRPVPAGTTFFPELLQRAGYETAFIGKWHMGDVAETPQPGFDRWVSFRGQGTYVDPVVNVDGERRVHGGYTAEILTDYAIDWMGQERDRPFFLYLSHKSVHAMFEPAAQDLGRYDDARLPYPATMAGTAEHDAGHPPWVREQRNSWHGVDYLYHGAMDFDTFYRRYTETLHGLDRTIGRVLDFLDSSGLRDSTLVIYTSDNGFSLGEHGLIDKRHMYEESMRVPMLVSAPGLVAPGSVATGMVQNIDIAPTVLELAGAGPPEDADGRSFLPLLRGEQGPWRDALLYEYYWEWNFPQTPTTFGLRTDRYKYIFYHGVWGQDEFFDLLDDPLEQRNLIDSPEHQATIDGMKQQLFDTLERTGGMTVPLRVPQGFRGGDQRPE